MVQIIYNMKVKQTPSRGSIRNTSTTTASIRRPRGWSLGAVSRLSRRPSRVHLAGKSSNKNTNNFLNTMLSAKKYSQINPQVRDMVSGKSKNTHQRFATSKLAHNPTGQEGKWTQVNTNNNAVNINSVSRPTVLYHASKDNTLISAPIGSVLRSGGPTWHHTRHSWDFFVRDSERVIAEIHVPSRIIMNALKLQNSTHDDLVNHIRLAKLRSTTNKKLSMLTGDRPLLTTFKITPRLAPYGVPNGKSYATVIMPPFYAKVVGRSENKNKPDRVQMVFWKFVSADNRSMGRLINPKAVERYHQMFHHSRNYNDNVRKKILDEYRRLKNYMAAAPRNANINKLETMINNLRKVDNRNRVPLHIIKNKLSNNLQHMISHGYDDDGSRFERYDKEELINSIAGLIIARNFDNASFLWS